MNSTERPQEACPSSGRPAVFLLDGHGVVRQCTAAVHASLGWSAGELGGRAMTDICSAPDALGDWSRRPEEAEFEAVLRHRNGMLLEADVGVMPLSAGGSAMLLVFADLSPRKRPEKREPGHERERERVRGHEREQADEQERERERQQPLIRALFAQDPTALGLIVRGPDPSGQRVNVSPGFFGMGPRPGGGPLEVRLRDVLVAEDAEAIDRRLSRVLETGEPLVGWRHSARRHDMPDRERTVSVSAFRLEGPGGSVIGVAAVLADRTEHDSAQKQLALLDASAHRLGGSLDVTRNAEDVAQLLVPDFADQACVDLTEPVRLGGDAGSFVPGTPLHRVAVASVDGTWPADIYQKGDWIRARDLESDALSGGEIVVVPDLAALRQRLEVDPERLRLLFPSSAASALFVPLFARGYVLGVLSLWRGAERLRYTADDAPLIEAIASRAALSLDNARRYTRERRTVEELQRSLLPPPVMRTAAAETSGAYAPASSAAGTGGSWYDVIRLSGVRTAFVAGKVAGHGVHAAGAMGRLRSAVQTLADLDLPPDELLSHLDDLVTRIGKDEGHHPASVAGSLHGATCLYATYDPVTGQCLVTAAGHPAPLVVRRHTGAVDEVPLQAGPPLGSGTEPYETAQLLLHSGDVLAFHSGPSTDDTPGGAEDLRRLHDSARIAARTDTPVAEITEQMLRHLREEPRAEDLAMLLARAERVPPSRTVYWRLSGDPGQVSEARARVSAQLAEWGLEDMVMSTELVVSELVTNAIRYAGGPIGLRLIKAGKLICEVSDPSQSQPHLRRARLSDEGGRGLFLIAQLTDRWGSRYTTDGKTIWTEQAYEPGVVPAEGEV